jgi:O-antigen ligase
MTTSISNVSAGTPQPAQQAQPVPQSGQARSEKLPSAVQTVASSFIFLLICVAIIASTLAYGTVHYWALAVFEMGAALLVALWCVDAWRSRTLRFSKSLLQLPLIGAVLLGLIQLLPLGSPVVDSSIISLPVKQALSLDPYSTRLVLLQIGSLLIYFAATLAFTDNPSRLRTLVRTIIIFGFGLAIFGLIQSFTSPTKVYWLRDLPQSTPFGPFINRHHFAGYMELTIALPLGLLFGGAVEREKRALFIFAAAVMGVALIMTNSRGGIISLLAEIAFLVVVSGVRIKGRRGAHDGKHEAQGQSVALKALLGLALILCLFGGVVFFGGESALNRFVGTVNSNDPTTGRAHFWTVTLDIIASHPIIGTGLGSFGAAFPRFDTRNGLMRLEQAHNDYLQVLSDAGIVGGVLGLFFIIVLFRKGFARRSSHDVYRSAVALGAMTGCFAVLVHSFFDFTLHTTSNALLFLTMAALATINGRVEERHEGHRHRHHHHSRHRSMPHGDQHGEPRMIEGQG